MAVESAADRAVFVNADEFGSSAVYTPAAGGGGTVSGQFYNGAEQQAFGAPGVSSGQPSFRMWRADLPAGAEVESAGDPDVLTVAGTGYAVRGIVSGEDGMVTLLLEEQG